MSAGRRPASKASGWRPVPRRRAGRWGVCLAEGKVGVQCGGFCCVRRLWFILGRDGLRAVPFFSLYKGQLIYGTGRSPSLPGKQMVSNDYWSFHCGIWMAFRFLGAVLDDGNFVWPGEGRCPTWRVLLVSAAARDCSPPRSGTVYGALVPESGGRPVPISQHFPARIFRRRALPP